MVRFQLTVSMSDSDATALASVAPMISINSTGSHDRRRLIHRQHGKGDEYEIFNSLEEDGYRLLPQSPAPVRRWRQRVPPIRRTSTPSM